RNRGIPFPLVQLVIRLIEELKVDLRWPIHVSRGYLFPESKQSRQMLIRIRKHFIEMMDVDDDAEPVGQRLIDGPVNALGELAVDREGRLSLSMGGPADGQANALNSRLFHKSEIVGMERDTPGAFARGIERVAEIDAATELLVCGNHVLGS